ncbi:DUF2064 domain-containing protein [Hamadaea tsunoensis]|uniref:DUF2064 domain-containing protein n=1 Tax=Hamadaea tsunoensis TaxID=53368 RepID=UPI00041EAA99|nr:DUF2064 domain-containing protein [Hamadaea tsunoensis]
MNLQTLVLAKQPVPGRVKTRLCPPCTPPQAAAVAAAAIEDTLDAVDGSSAAARVLVLDGTLDGRPGWTAVTQCAGDLDVRLAHAFRSTARPGWASLLIGMDTPQATAGLLDAAAGALSDADAALGLAADGGWWALALREPSHAEALIGVRMSQDDTGLRTLAALRARGLAVAELPVLRDVDTAADAWAVAAAHPHGRFAAAVQAHVPAVVR